MGAESDLYPIAEHYGLTRVSANGVSLSVMRNRPGKRQEEREIYSWEKFGGVG